jgi:hypothetical protein
MTKSHLALATELHKGQDIIVERVPMPIMAEKPTPAAIDPDLRVRVVCWTAPAVKLKEGKGSRMPSALLS